MKSSIIINGQFTARRVTGQERFALEIILELDKICKKDITATPLVDSFVKKYKPEKWGR